MARREASMHNLVILTALKTTLRSLRVLDVLRYLAVKWFRKTVARCRKAAEQGYAPVQYNLGICYELGEGVPQDHEQAAKWYRKAAEWGYAPAQYNLGLCYILGAGVPQDHEQAAKWYRKAAEQGVAGAQYHLGGCYHNGEGVPQDAVVAYMWFNLAGATVCAARNERNSLSRTMTPEQIVEALRLSREWKAKTGL